MKRFRFAAALSVCFAVSLALCAGVWFLRQKGKDPAGLSSAGESVISAGESVAGSSERDSGESGEGQSGTEEGTETGESGPLPDGTPPVLTVSWDGETRLSARPGEEILLPEVRAFDERDGDLTDSVETTVSPAGYARVEEGIFYSRALGIYEIVFRVADGEGNETCETLTVEVSSEEYAETEDVTGENDPNAIALAEKGRRAVFRENFGKGGDSPLLPPEGLAGHFSLEAGERSLSGNSLVADYAACVGKENEFCATTLPVRSGVWEISFDVRLCGGIAFPDFTVGFRKGGDRLYDRKFSLAEMREGEVRRIVYEGQFDFEETGWQFRFYKEYRDGDAVLAFDNFTFSYVNVVRKETVPDADALAKGFTFDWTDFYTPVGSATPLLTEDIPDGEALGAIRGANEGFGSSVMRLKGSGGHEIAALSAEKVPCLYRAGTRCRIEIRYYAAKTSTDYLIALNGTPENRILKEGLFGKGLHLLTAEFSLSEEDDGLTFFFLTDADVYLGNFTVLLLPSGE